MGWTFQHRDKGWTERDWLADNLLDADRIVDVAKVGNVDYVAYRVRSIHNEDGDYDAVTCLVLLTRWIRGDSDYYNFGYKDMDESMGPHEAKCPERILDVLSPLEMLYEPSPDKDWSYEWARDWRKACRAYHTHRKAAKAVTPGTTIRFKHPLTFTSGVKLDTFVREGKNVFTVPGGWTRYKIPSWRDYEFEVLDSLVVV
jgi:hypothetical protein